MTKSIIKSTTMINGVVTEYETDSGMMTQAQVNRFIDKLNKAELMSMKEAAKTLSEAFGIHPSTARKATRIAYSDLDIE